MAYENLRASQEEFFKNRGEEVKKACDDEEGELIEASLIIQDLRIHDDANEDRGGIDNEDDDNGSLEGSSNVKRRRDKLLEEARNSVPESGSGRVMHLVKAFEKLLSMPKSKKDEEEEVEEEEENEKKEHNDQGHGEGNNNNTNSKNRSKVMKWALPGLQFEQPHKAPETEVSGSGSSSSSSLFCASDLVLTSENLGLDSRISVSSSWDSSRGRFDFDPPKACFLELCFCLSFLVVDVC